MKKILLFIFENMTDFEITFATHLLSTSGDKEIITIAYEDTPIKVRSGLTITPIKVVSEVLEEEVEGLIIPGGWYGDFREELKQLINNLNASKKLLAGICGTGTVFLAKAGVFDNLTYTTPAIQWTMKHIKVFGEEDPFPRENFIQERVIRDNNVITAQGTAFIDFAIEICDYFHLFYDQEDKINFAREIKGE